MSASLEFVGHSVLLAFGLATVLLTVQLAAFLPFTIVYEIWKWRILRRLSREPFSALVSVLVPAYNEEKTIRACIESLLASDYANREIIVINDGSVDSTESVLRDLIEERKIRYFYQANSGKAAALNRAASLATGEVLLYTDADSVFLPNTISQMMRWFAEPGIHAVCGNDMPLNERTPLQKVLAVTTHIGTGFVRRALSIWGVLPIIAGNLGAVRTKIFREVGGFRRIWGEDLEFTFRLQAAGKRIIFDPSPIVRAECPAGLSALWRQRIRWVRSYLNVSALYLNLFRSRKAFPFSLYLAFNYFAQVIVPLLQIASVPLFLGLVVHGNGLNLAWYALLYFGLATFAAIAVYSILLDLDPKTLRHVPIAVFLIAPLSYFYDFVVLSSIWQELFRKPEHWHKIERLPTGVIGRRGGVGLVAMGIVFAGLASALRFSSPLVVNDAIPQPVFFLSNLRPVSSLMHADDGRVHDIAVATHFDGWQDWRSAITSILQNPTASRLHTIGLSAGRVEWAHFRWRGHEQKWSSLQKKASVDILGVAIGDFKKHGFRTVAMVDLYSPKLIKSDPQKAAIRFDGAQSTEQVCFSELVDGDYGRQVIEMVSYVAHNYPVDSIALTEVGYYSFCFDDRCLRSYERATGHASWPVKGSTSNPDREDPTVWEWRTARMEQFLEKVAAAAHGANKHLIVDVPVSWTNLQRRGKDSGLDYARVLRHADQIVVWNYFGVEDRKPEVSRNVVDDLTHTFPSNRFFVSVGLWRSHGSIDPETLRQGITYTLEGGVPNIWITPNELLSQAHWEVIDQTLERTNVTSRMQN